MHRRMHRLAITNGNAECIVQLSQMATREYRLAINGGACRMHRLAINKNSWEKIFLNVKIHSQIYSLFQTFVFMNNPIGTRKYIPK